MRLGRLSIDLVIFAPVFLMAIETCTPLAWAIYSVCLVSAYRVLDHWI